MSENSAVSAGTLLAFAVCHRGVGGEGTGYTLVVASSVRIARLMAGTYLRDKLEGGQFTSFALLDVMPLEESPAFSELPVDCTEGGVKFEYWFKPGEEEGEHCSEPVQVFPS